jgi:PhoH-like ATPase
MAKKKTTGESKIFVIDTSVILYDFNAINNFGEHDVIIPITVLEELDNFKKGNDTKNFQAREFIRLLDDLSGNYTLNDWIPLVGKGKGKIKVWMNERTKNIDANKVFGEAKADHRILNAALGAVEENPGRPVVLVSKDINLRLKAKALNLTAEDFETGKIRHIDDLYKGRETIADLDSAIIDELYRASEIDVKRIPAFKKNPPADNQYFVLKNGKSSVLAFYNPETQKIERVEKNLAFGIKPRNAEQVFALHALENPNVKLVTIQGVAGTGKTLLALAGALNQKRDYRQIFLARPIVPLSNKDIGYLPGDVKSKLNPYMEPLWDNLKMIQGQWDEGSREHKKIQDMVDQEKLVVQPLAYIRGRSLSNIFFIVDEAQNLTPHEVKTIITRAGEGTKIIFTGDIYQIDTPYLDAQSNGLSYLIDKLKGQKLYAHIALEKGERSELANLANELL